MRTCDVLVLGLLGLTACPGGDAPFTRDDGGGVRDASATDGTSFDATVPPTDADPGDSAGTGGDSGDGATGQNGSGARCGVNGRDDCGPFRVCDVARGCGDCTTDNECPLAAPFCVADHCVSCRSGDVDGGAVVSGCGAGAPACWPANHTCHAACKDASSCPANAHICDQPTGECRGCESDLDCDGRVCSPSTRSCVDCNQDLDCPRTKPRCDLARSVCTACASNDDCGVAAPICDPTTRACRVGCTSDAQCPGQRCDPALAVCADVLDAGSDADADDGSDAADE